MSDITICDAENCESLARITVQVLEFGGDRFDACSFGHAERIYREARLEDEEEEPTA